MKKIFLASFIFLTFFISRSVFAGLIITPAPPINNLSKTVHISCTNGGDTVVVYVANSGDYVGQYSCPNYFTGNYLTSGGLTNGTYGLYRLVECNSSLAPCYHENYSQAFNDAGYVGENMISYINPVATGVFFGGENVNERQQIFINDLGASVGTTTNDLKIPLGVVGGIILAFIGVRFIISLFYGATSDKTTK